MSTCLDTPILPRLLVHQPGEAFTVALDWSGHLADGEAVASAASDTERAPPGSDDIIDATTNTTTTSSIRFAVPTDAAPGQYVVHHDVQTSAGLQYRECFTVLIEGC